MTNTDNLIDAEQKRAEDEKAAKPELPGIGHNVGGVSGVSQIFHRESRAP